MYFRQMCLPKARDGHNVGSGFSWPPNLTQPKDGHPMVNSKKKLLALLWLTAACYTSICTVKNTAVAVATGTSCY